MATRQWFPGEGRQRFSFPGNASKFKEGAGCAATAVSPSVLAKEPGFRCFEEPAQQGSPGERGGPDRGGPAPGRCYLFLHRLSSQTPPPAGVSREPLPARSAGVRQLGCLASRGRLGSRERTPPAPPLWLDNPLGSSLLRSSKREAHAVILGQGGGSSNALQLGRKRRAWRWGNLHFYFILKLIKISCGGRCNLLVLKIMQYSKINLLGARETLGWRTAEWFLGCKFERRPDVGGCLPVRECLRLPICAPVRIQHTPALRLELRDKVGGGPRARPRVRLVFQGSV